MSRIEAKGAARGTADGTTLAVRAPRSASVDLVARLNTGGTLSAVR
ncbi:hypothetical protein [Streptomyces finlayi]|nr:hypothetical protein [Streptomyces finlayi]